MEHFDTARTAERLGYDRLIADLRAGQGSPAHVPRRQHFPVDEEQQATLLVMPAWNREFLGVKLVNVFPRNSEQGLPALSSAYLLADGRTGQHLALIDGSELTRRRTVGTAALGASLLSREDSRTHLIIGTGHIGGAVHDAYAAVRDIKNTLVADPYDFARARALAAVLNEQGASAEAVEDVESAAGRADIITCATLAREPILRDQWVRPGTHLDLIGSFRPDMCEVEPTLLGRSTVFIDNEAAVTEAGELVDALTAGVLREDDIAATLPELCRVPGSRRRSDGEITVFKTVGTGLADLVAAIDVYTGP